jgi:hypothetical protein
MSLPRENFSESVQGISCVEGAIDLGSRAGGPYLFSLKKAQPRVARANSFARGVSIEQAPSNEHRQTSLAVPPGEREAPR